MAMEFKSNKIVAMHVLQRLVYISGTNHSYIMIQCVARAWESWLPVLHHVNSMSGSCDIQLPFQNVKTLQ